MQIINNLILDEVELNVVIFQWQADQLFVETEDFLKLVFNNCRHDIMR